MLIFSHVGKIGLELYRLSSSSSCFCSWREEQSRKQISHPRPGLLLILLALITALIIFMENAGTISAS